MADKPLVGGKNHKAIIEDIQFHAEKMRGTSRELVDVIEPIHHKLDPRILKLIREQAEHIMQILLLTKDGSHLIDNARNGSVGAMEAKLLELTEIITNQEQRIEMLESRVGMDEVLSDILETTRNGR